MSFFGRFGFLAGFQFFQLLTTFSLVPEV